MAEESWRAATRILAIRLDAVGDLLMTTPALRALKAGTDRHVTLLFTVYSQNPLPSAFLAWLAGIPLRLAHCHENPYQLLTDWVPDPEPQQLVRHEVRRQLDLVRTVGCSTGDERLTLVVPPAARLAVARLLRELGLEDRDWVLLHPGASAPSRRYPPEALGAAARRLSDLTGRQVVVAGSEHERALVDSVREAIGRPSHSLAGRLRFPEFAALVERAPLLIGNNSAPVHVAAAVGTPVVDLYALTNPQHTPWGVPHRVLSRDVPCRFCYKSVCPERHGNCLRLVSPDEVVAAALELLGERPARPRR